MNTAIISTVIGVIGTGLFGLFFMQLNNLREDMKAGFEATNLRFDHLNGKVDNLTGDLHALDTKFTGELKDQFHALDTKFTGELRAHGERLARIEAKLEIDPPAEAA